MKRIVGTKVFTFHFSLFIIKYFLEVDIINKLLYNYNYIII